MNLDAQVVLTLRELLIVFVAGGVAAFLFVLLCATIGGLFKPSAHEQRLKQIQIDEEQRDLDLYTLTQGYLERVKSEAQHQRSPAQRGQDFERFSR